MTTGHAMENPASAVLPTLRALVREAWARTASASALPATLEASSPLVRSTVDELASETAREALWADPYWPKWDSPRWKMLLLRELGLADSIPRATADRLAEVLDQRCLHVWPMRKEDIPRQEPRPPFLCHCHLASTCLLLRSCGRDDEQALPWATPWLLRCQLPDGGLICDPASYWKPNARSTFTATISPMEAILGLVRPWSAEELAYLERGARFLLQRGLCRSYRKDPQTGERPWFELQFPRCYHYDMLRGLSFVTLWAEKTGQLLPAQALLEPVSELTQRLDAQGALASRSGWPEDEGTWGRDAQGKPVRIREASVFPLLAEVSRPGVPSPYLTAEWREALARLQRLDQAGQLGTEPAGAGLEMLGPYRLLEPLGRGGMGQVHRAEHVSTRAAAVVKRVALPRLPMLQGLRREIAALARIAHPGVVRVLESSVERGLPWYAMELVEGLDLRQYCRRHFTPALPSVAEAPTRPLGAGAAAPAVQTPPSAAAAARGPLQEGVRAVLDVFRRLCSALAHLHGEGLVHRDLKPGNILVRPDGQPVLLDFGLAARFAGGLGREALEQDEGVAGTAAYMSPEQVRGDLVDARADLYSLGCLLYEAFAGRPPFVGDGPTQVLEQHLAAEPPALSRVACGVPAELEALTLRLLRKDPRGRLGYAEDVRSELARLAGTGSPAAETLRPRSYLYRPRLQGRDPELAWLTATLQLQQPQAGRMVLIGGESGLGKTRLALELSRRVLACHVPVLVGESQNLRGEGAPALGALRRPLQQIADRCRERGAQETERLLGAAGPVLVPYEPALAALPGLRRAEPSLPRPADDARLQLYTALGQTLLRLADGAPLMLVLDDLHAADDLTLGFLQHALDSDLLERGALLLVGTYRRDEVGPDLARLLGHAQAARLDLQALDDSATAGIVADMLALPKAPAVFSRYLARQSEGNPFFVAEYLLAAVEEGLLWREQGRWQVTGPAGRSAAEADYESLALPHSLRELIGRRLQALPEAALRAAEAAAVLGRETPVQRLERVLELSGTATGAPLEALGELLRRRVLEDAEPGSVRFVHDKLREVALEALEPGRRRRLHRAAAEALEALEPEHKPLAALAGHWEEAGEPDLARPRYLEAAHEAERCYLRDEAERLYRAFLRLTRTPDRESIRARLRLATAILEPRNRYQQAEAECNQALAEARAAGDSLCECESLGVLCTVLHHMGRLKEALPLHERAFELAVGLGTRPLQAKLLMQQGGIATRQGRFEEARSLMERSMQIHRQDGNLLGVAITLHNLGTLCLDRGAYEEARGLFEQAMEAARQEPLGDFEINGLTSLAMVCRELGLEDRALSLYAEALAKARAYGLPREEVHTIVNLAYLHHEAGRLEEARALYDRVLSLCRQMGNSLFVAPTLVVSARLERQAGNAAAARQRLGRAEALLKASGHRIFLGMCLCEQGHVALALGESGAAELLREAEAIAAPMPLGPESDLGRSIGRLRRALDAASAGKLEELVQGDWYGDLPAKLRPSTDAGVAKAARLP
jgi:serine/threonine protein kinase/tetratricopeptide (TPR) repeat protein